MKDVAVSEIMYTVENWQWKIELQGPCSAKYKNNLALATDNGVTVTVLCFVTFKDEVVNQIINAINSKEIKAKAIQIILRNEARCTQELTGILEKGQMGDGEVDVCLLEKCNDNQKDIHHVGISVVSG